MIAAAQKPELVDGIALICPGLHPRVGVTRRERLQIAWAFLTNRHKRFPIPLSDPALFTANPDGQAFIAADRLSLHEGTAGLLAASFFIDRWVKRAPARIRQPALLMLAGQDRIVDNAATSPTFKRWRRRTAGDRVSRRVTIRWNSSLIHHGTPSTWSTGSTLTSPRPRPKWSE